MEMSGIPFGTTDWNKVERTEHDGTTGTAYWRTREFGGIRVRVVEYSPGYMADHWCRKGHILFCIAGQLDTELQDGRTFKAKLVGSDPDVDIAVLKALRDADDDLIPVVAPVGIGEDGARYNINADTAAGAVAAALGASRLLLLTDVAGVLDKQKNLIREIKVKDIPGLIADGTAAGGMIPKLETAAHSVIHGVGAAVILDGRAPHALLMELFIEHGAGTLVS